MSKREIDSKVHKLRRAFIISAISVGLLTLGVGIFAGITSKPVLLAVNCCLLAGAIGLTVGLGVAVNKLSDLASAKINSSIADKALQQIKEFDKDKTSIHSQAKRKRALIKYAKANLRLTKIYGATPFGELHATSGISNEKGAHR